MNPEQSTDPQQFFKSLITHLRSSSVIHRFWMDSERLVTVGFQP